jgi:pimeloyl-ACP methyl ester carboxylesterase
VFDEPLSTIAVPTLVIHGTADPMFPLEHGQALAEAPTMPALAQTTGQDVTSTTATSAPELAAAETAEMRLDLAEACPDMAGRACVGPVYLGVCTPSRG